MGKTKQIKLGIADDAPFIREIVRQIINSDKSLALVAEARDGEEAVGMANENELDVILMDMVLPKKNGIAAASEILQRHPSLKIIACSTLDQENLVMQALEAGCCNYLTKPFTAEDLKLMIKKSMITKTKGR